MLTAQVWLVPNLSKAPTLRCKMDHLRIGQAAVFLYETVALFYEDAGRLSSISRVS